jgi:SpoVK/Ycf46/Vps4 family AAA+-type ATPase
MKFDRMEEKSDMREDIAHLVRLGLSGRVEDVQLYAKRLAKRLAGDDPEFAAKLDSLLSTSPVRSSPLRRGAATEASPIPVDLDSRMHLARVDTVLQLEIEPVFAGNVGPKLRQLVKERAGRGRLRELGLNPTRTALFVGAPGVGKTLAAKWVARELRLPLVTLDLGSVMSSFLGRTGNNVRHVLDYAKGVECVLLIDELDAIAKRRDDSAEVGELKRLVTVLLQEIDNWPADGLLLAATNHPDLLDPAVWRRFELIVEFPKPEGAELHAAIGLFLGDAKPPAHWKVLLAMLYRGVSFSDLERSIKSARRYAAIEGLSGDSMLRELVRWRVATLSRSERSAIATELVKHKIVSQREAHELTGVSRDTIRKVMREGEDSCG